MVVLPSRRLGRASGRTPLGHADAYLERHANTRQMCMAEGLVCGLQNNRIIRSDLNSVAEGVKGSTEREVHVAHERLLRPPRSGGHGCLRGRLLDRHVAYHLTSSPLLVRQNPVCTVSLIQVQSWVSMQPADGGKSGPSA